MAIGLGQTGENLLQRSQSLIGQAVDRGTGLLADRIEHYTNVARDVSDILRQRGEPGAADLVQSLSQRATGIAGYLRTNDGARMWSDAQDFARGRTWLLTGVGLISGLAIARAMRTTYSATSDDDAEYVDSYAQPYRTSMGRTSVTDVSLQGADYERTT
jgi:hypothetical protein